MIRTLCLTAVLLAFTLPALAGTGGTTGPWDTGLTQIMNILTGTTARTLIIIATAIMGITWAFRRHEQGANFFLAVAIGGSIALAAPAVTNLFGAGALF